jgi:hypothetical protein
MAKACLFVGANAGPVELVDLEQDIVQPQHRETKVEDQARRLGAVSLPTAIGFADDDAILRCAVAIVDVGEVGVAYGPQRTLLVEREQNEILVSNDAIVGVGFLFQGCSSAGR